MIILISGSSHTGKTLLAKRLMRQYQIPYFCIDHLKMGLIRSHQTSLTPCDDTQLSAYLWPIVKEMIKTVIENKQNLIIEGCYIPFDWQKDFNKEYLKEIRYCCLVFSESYIQEHFSDIKQYANIIEQRIDDSHLSKTQLIKENQYNQKMCEQYQLPYQLIQAPYDVDIQL